MAAVPRLFQHPRACRGGAGPARPWQAFRRDVLPGGPGQPAPAAAGALALACPTLGVGVGAGSRRRPRRRSAWMRAHAGALLGFPGREGRGAAEAPAPAVSGDLRPHSGLLLIDCQKAFLTGFWAQYFGGGDEVAPIRQAFRNTVELLRSPERLSGCAVLCTKCYTEGEEADYDDDLKPLLAGAPCFWKPTTDITRNSHFHKWFEERLSAGMQTLVIGGCTTTSCVRVSSQAIRRMYPDSTLRVVVDLSLCGARVSNFLGNAELDPVLRPPDIRPRAVHREVTGGPGPLSNAGRWRGGAG
ncbi:unnamed protein product [Prorocentrum cordatum]|uniref:Isochorismatase-like domain-containing protein n=1 Tax=Prorocentrum cordatum TaxID=2364126 RepID=A0ABN9T2M4_9DINO|nr:unnamed protein product [Polarella glacialis]